MILSVGGPGPAGYFSHPVGRAAAPGRPNHNLSRVSLRTLTRARLDRFNVIVGVYHVSSELRWGDRFDDKEAADVFAVEKREVLPEPSKAIFVACTGTIGLASGHSSRRACAMRGRDGA
jgi:hypothetical protein